MKKEYAEYADAAAGYARRAREHNTVRSYRGTWTQYVAWCEEAGVEVFPGTAGQVAAWLAWLADARGLKASTILQKLSALRRQYADEVGAANCTRDEAVIRTLEGICRTHGMRPAQKSALTAAHVREMVRGLDRKTPAGLRDRALLLLGFITACRSQELANLEWSDIRFEERGALLLLRKSKTDARQHGEWRAVGKGRKALTCPIHALVDWRRVCVHDGPVFCAITRGGRIIKREMDTKSIRGIVKRAVEGIGLDPALYAAHSLRAGFATTMLTARNPEALVVAQTGHRDRGMLDTYHRPDDKLAFNYTKAVGL